MCASDYSPALDAIADTLIDQIRPACMQACVADTDPSTPILDASCTLVERIPSDAGPQTKPMQACTLLCGGTECGPGQHGQADAWDFPAASADVCYRMLIDDKENPQTASSIDNMDTECTDDGWNLEFVIERREGKPAVGGTAVEATCQLSAVEELDCPNL